ncbi:MAG: formylglycine-generating enzyme family protein [Candidatus Hatepunaea meridiana]|nr:formylglycine-generating enzyme family protein [Candidatus Hatepunaea meridiana]
MFTQKHNIFVTVLWVSLFFIQGCNKENPVEPANPDFEISQQTVVIDSTRFTDLIIDGNRYSFSFIGCPEAISVGDKLVLNKSGGYLRKVTNVEIQGTRVILITEDASLTDAIVQGSIEQSFEAKIGGNSRTNGHDEASVMHPVYFINGVSEADGSLRLDGVELYNGTIEYNGQQVDLTCVITKGSVGFEPSVDLGFSIQNSILDEFHAIATGELEFDCTMELTCSRRFEFEKEITIAQYYIGTFVQMVGPIPIIEVVNLEFVAGFKAESEFEATFETGLVYQSNINIGARYLDSHWSPIWSYDDLRPQEGPIRWCPVGDVSLYGYIKPRLSIDFFTVAGPYLEVEPYLRFDGETDIQGWRWDLYQGLDANLGFHVEILDMEIANYNNTILGDEVLVAGDNGSPPPNFPPSIPANPRPSDHATDQPTELTLGWECSDPEGDQLSYHIYFGVEANPPLIRQGLDRESFNPGTLNSGQKYFWKVVVNDNHGHSTEGPIWYFSTREPNRPPYQPVNPSPVESAVNQPLDIVLSWQCSDPDDDRLLYDVFFGTSNTPPKDSTDQSETSYNPGSLNFEQTYYWKVEAKDNQDHSTEGPIWQFTTIRESNRPPYSPSNPIPVDRSADQPVNLILSWDCNDPDNDRLLYDVSFGTSSPPPKVSRNQSEVSYNPGLLSFEQTYYWKVEAKDGQGHTTEGDIWHFTTTGSDNRLPHSPSNPTPVDRSANQPVNLILSWDCNDPDNDQLLYDISFGTSYPPPKVTSDQNQTRYNPGLLSYEQTYYWMVEAKDGQGHLTEGPIWQFTTMQDPNLPPDLPNNPSPLNEATDQSIDVTLSWDCSDPNGDRLTYDVYFGTNRTPPQVSTDQAVVRFNPGRLNFEQTYYWKVIARDIAGLTTSGSIWHFTTQHDPDDRPGGEEHIFQLANDVDIVMVWIPSGSFMMGALDGERDAYDNERPRHRVTFDNGFWMGKYELTQAQWIAIMENNPSEFNGNNRPVEQVSWNDIHTFLSRIDDVFRLPAESEWEYACRSGHDNTRFFWGDDNNYGQLGQYAWYGDNSSHQTHDVGRKLPNRWGLYDIHGNVWEWCEDPVHYNYNGAPDDGSVWEGGNENVRIYRGGCWYYEAAACRTALRNEGGPTARLPNVGFRLVRRGD